MKLNLLFGALVCLVMGGCAQDDPLELSASGRYCTESDVVTVAAPAADPADAHGDGEHGDMDEHGDTETHGDMDMDDDTMNHDDDTDAHDDMEMVVADVAYDVAMTEFAYDCLLPELERGTLVALHFDNVGTVEHEAVVGDMAEQEEAEAAMQAMADAGEDDGAHGAHGGASISLQPGERGSLLVTVGDSGELVIGCHLPGHWEAGMRMNLTLST